MSMRWPNLRKWMVKVVSAKIHFTLSEYCITSGPIPQNIADKILKYHIIPMSVIREILGFRIIVSKRSGYRPEKYEKSRGRNGKSQHCFIEKGAGDYTADTKEELLLLLEEMKKSHTYTRIAYYPNDLFIHGDYQIFGQYQYFECESPTSKWEYKGSF